MGMQAEFNWYIVLKEDNVLDNDDRVMLQDGQIDVTSSYAFKKSDYRIYPMDTPLPLIYNGKCLAMGIVTNLSWNGNITTFTVQPVVTFRSDDPAAIYYESSFNDYKLQQEEIDDGGKVNLRSVINPVTRMRF
jgi:hypothetical protein